MSTLSQRFGELLLRPWVFSPIFFGSCWALSALDLLAMSFWGWDPTMAVFIFFGLQCVGWCSYFAERHIERLRASGDKQ